jgi:hypothetical protein
MLLVVYLLLIVPVSFAEDNSTSLKSKANEDKLAAIKSATAAFVSKANDIVTSYSLISMSGTVPSTVYVKSKYVTLQMLDKAQNNNVLANSFRRKECVIYIEVKTKDLIDDANQNKGSYIANAAYINLPLVSKFDLNKKINDNIYYIQLSGKKSVIFIVEATKNFMENDGFMFVGENKEDLVMLINAMNDIVQACREKITD